MNILAAEVEWEDAEEIIEQGLDTGGNLRLIRSEEQGIYVFFRHQLFAQYQTNDQYSRNLIMVQLFLCHKVAQKQLSKVFGLTVPHISCLVRKYRSEGSVGIENNIQVRVNNNQKIKGKIAKAVTKQLELNEAARPSYGALSKIIRKKYGVSISR